MGRVSSWGDETVWRRAVATAALHREGLHAAGRHTLQRREWSVPRSRRAAPPARARGACHSQRHSRRPPSCNTRFTGDDTGAPLFSQPGLRRVGAGAVAASSLPTSAGDRPRALAVPTPMHTCSEATVPATKGPVFHSPSRGDSACFLMRTRPRVLALVPRGWESRNLHNSNDRFPPPGMKRQSFPVP